MTDDPNARLDDAFPLTADPSTYFPRLALESALTELAELIGGGPTCAALIGEPGLGKTLLLRILKERLEGAFECVYVPFPRLDPAELWSWLAVALGHDRSEDPRAVVVEHARRRAANGVGLVLLVDDAGALPRETRRALILGSRSGAFSLVMAFSSEDRAALAELPASVRRIDLGPPMTLAETRAYVRARLRRVDPNGVIAARLGPAQMADLHEASAGVPALLHPMLDSWLRGGASEQRPGPARAPAAPRSAPAPAERRSFFPRRERRRNQLALAFLLVLLFAGFWHFAPRREPPVEAAAIPVEPAEPPRAEAAPAPVPSEPAELLVAPEPSEAALAVAPDIGEPLAPPPPAEPTPAPLAEAAPAESPTEAPAAAPVPSEAAAPPADEVLAALPTPSAAPTPELDVAPEPPPREPPAPQLAPPAAGPRLSVNAEPWAEIQLDGKPVGETPLGELPLSPGSHRVRATFPDGRVLERNVEAPAGDVYVVFP